MLLWTIITRVTSIFLIPQVLHVINWLFILIGRLCKRKYVNRMLWLLTPYLNTLTFKISSHWIKAANSKSRRICCSIPFKTFTMSIVLPNMEKFTVGDEVFSVSFSFDCVSVNARNDTSFVRVNFIETDISTQKQQERSTNYLMQRMWISQETFFQESNNI